MARIWCTRCNVHHECEDDHGPDGHGGSSVCCPVQRVELATGHVERRRKAVPSGAGQIIRRVAIDITIADDNLSDDQVAKIRAIFTDVSGHLATLLLAAGLAGRDVDLGWSTHMVDGPPPMPPAGGRYQFRLDRSSRPV